MNPHVRRAIRFFISAIVFLTINTFSTRAALGAMNEPLTIRNDTLVVTFDPSSGDFSLATLSPARVEIQAIKLPTIGRATLLNVNDVIFGPGQAIRIFDENGAGGEVAVYHGLPFAMIRVSLKNSTAQLQVLNRVRVASFITGDTTADGALRVRGTGGLSKPEKAPGSYEWIAVASHSTQCGVVAGFITHDRATGVLLPTGDAGKVRIDARSEFGRLRFAPGATA